MITSRLLGTIWYMDSIRMAMTKWHCVCWWILLKINAMSLKNNCLCFGVTGSPTPRWPFETIGKQKFLVSINFGTRKTCGYPKNVYFRHRRCTLLPIFSGYQIFTINGDVFVVASHSLNLACYLSPPSFLSSSLPTWSVFLLLRFVIVLLLSSTTKCM